MSRGLTLWRRRLWVWVPPAVALAIASAYLLTLSRGLRSQGSTLAARLATAERTHGEAQSSLARLEALDADARRSREQIARLMEEQFSTESGRFTSLVREIKQLAEHSGLDPKEIGYPEESLADLGLVRRSFIFGVQGSYVNLRAFLYLLELSPSYVTVDSIEVRELSGGRGLAVNLRLSTFFAAPETPEAAATAAREGRS